jgi:hypothetical protein
VLFVDFVKAFDTVPREMLFKVLARLGFPPKIVNLVRVFHENMILEVDLQPRVIKHPSLRFGAAPGGPAVAGRRANAPPRRTGVPAAGEPKIGPGVRFFSTTRD